MIEWIGQITYGQISNIILALGLLAVLIVIGVFIFVNIVGRKQ